MFPRLAPALTATLALLVVAGCAGTSAAPVAMTPPAAPGGQPVATPGPTPVPAPTEVATPPVTENAGDVDGSAKGPQLTVEFPREDTIDVTLEDPEAKAWRIVVSGTGALDQDRLELVVETSDVAPVITATEIQQGEVVGIMDLTGYLDETAAAGGCHRTLGVCVDSSWFVLPVDGSGPVGVRLQVPEPGPSLVVTGGTAGWPGEPFVLGPWSDTEAFPWGEG
jgi:hypothetical protein